LRCSQNRLNRNLNFYATIIKLICKKPKHLIPHRCTQLCPASLLLLPRFRFLKYLHKANPPLLAFTLRLTLFQNKSSLSVIHENASVRLLRPGSTARRPTFAGPGSTASGEKSEKVYGRAAVGGRRSQRTPLNCFSTTISSARGTWTFRKLRSVHHTAQSAVLQATFITGTILRLVELHVSTLCGAKSGKLSGLTERSHANFCK